MLTMSMSEHFCGRGGGTTVEPLERILAEAEVEAAMPSMPSKPSRLDDARF